jgi:PPK2 family polyphosphate:nucleotide phosphotransferase
MSKSWEEIALRVKKYYLVKPGADIRLDDDSASDDNAFSSGKDDGLDILEELRKKLDSLQELLYAQHKHKVLIVLQGMDTSGKDGTIRHVFEGVNPQGVRVAPFKAPVGQELEYDYLWRAHKQVPRKGEIVIFNRSHYEDILVPVVHKLVDKDEIKRRYRQINDFEKMLAEEGTLILKFFLHISRKEQKARLEARLEDKDKNWKFSAADVKERVFWPDYLKVFEDILNKTSNDYAPWYVVPADKKWYRNLVTALTIVKALDDLGMDFPKVDKQINNLKIV